MDNTERMYEFDLSKCTRDQLLLVLRTAKGEIVKYTNYAEEIERIEEDIKNEKKKERKANIIIGWLVVPSIFFIFVSFSLLFHGSSIDSNITGIQLMFLSLPLIVFLFQRKNTRKNLKKYEEELPYLLKKAKEAYDKILAGWIIPYNYRYKFAVTKMCEFVEDKRASNWERVTDLYEEYLHRGKMEGIAQRQTELAQQNLDSTRRTEVAAWAAAAGIAFIALRR